MCRYIALLRGVNISGKNKISMTELKQNFMKLRFSEVTTYLNSGNIIFSTDNCNETTLNEKIYLMLKNVFCLEIPVLVIKQTELIDALHHSPCWWGNDNKDIYDNLIFLIPPLNYEEFYNNIGDINPEFEKSYAYKNVVFWSFDRMNYKKTNWWSKTASTKISKQITIRTANTIKKAASL